ncbi:MAG TPA: nuclear transport factor 2 family protein [Thermoleophilaceae bacterium]|nr:nuclear transport factor 2 family protein [Thermoleophilaceae bacterium]
MPERANAGLIRDMFSTAERAAETGSLDEWLSFFSENIVWEAAEDAPDAGIYRGQEAIRGYLQDWLDTVDGFRQEPRELTEVGDRVVADIRFEARIKGTQNEMALDYSQVSLIEGGKITHVKEFLEHADAAAYAAASERGGS